MAAAAAASAQRVDSSSPYQESAASEAFSPSFCVQLVEILLACLTRLCSHGGEEHRMTTALQQEVEGGSFLSSVALSGEEAHSDSASAANLSERGEGIDSSSLKTSGSSSRCRPAGPRAEWKKSKVKSELLIRAVIAVRNAAQHRRMAAALVELGASERKRGGREDEGRGVCVCERARGMAWHTHALSAQSRTQGLCFKC